MSDGEKDGVAPSLKDVAAGEKASRDKFVEDGGPQQQPPEGQTSAEDQPTGMVSKDK